MPSHDVLLPTVQTALGASALTKATPPRFKWSRNTTSFDVVRGLADEVDSPAQSSSTHQSFHAPNWSNKHLDYHQEKWRAEGGEEDQERGDPQSGHPQQASSPGRGGGGLSNEISPLDATIPSTKRPTYQRTTRFMDLPTPHTFVGIRQKVPLATPPHRPRISIPVELIHVRNPSPGPFSASPQSSGFFRAAAGGGSVETSRSSGGSGSAGTDWQVLDTRTLDCDGDGAVQDKRNSVGADGEGQGAEEAKQERSNGFKSVLPNTSKALSSNRLERIESSPSREDEQCLAGNAESACQPNNTEITGEVKIVNPQTRLPESTSAYPQQFGGSRRGFFLDAGASHLKIQAGATAQIHSARKSSLNPRNGCQRSKSLVGILEDTCGTLQQTSEVKEHLRVRNVSFWGCVFDAESRIAEGLNESLNKGPNEPNKGGRVAGPEQIPSLHPQQASVSSPSSGGGAAPVGNQRRRTRAMELPKVPPLLSLQRVSLLDSRETGSLDLSERHVDLPKLGFFKNHTFELRQDTSKGSLGSERSERSEGLETKPKLPLLSNRTQRGGGGGSESESRTQHERLASRTVSESFAQSVSRIQNETSLMRSQSDSCGSRRRSMHSTQTLFMIGAEQEESRQAEQALNHMRNPSSSSSPLSASPQSNSQSGTATDSRSVGTSCGSAGSGPTGTDWKVMDTQALDSDGDGAVLDKQNDVGADVEGQGEEPKKSVLPENKKSFDFNPEFSLIPKLSLKPKVSFSFDRQESIHSDQWAKSYSNKWAQSLGAIKAKSVSIKSIESIESIECTGQLKAEHVDQTVHAGTASLPASDKPKERHQQLSQLEACANHAWYKMPWITQKWPKDEELRERASVRSTEAQVEDFQILNEIGGGNGTAFLCRLKLARAICPGIPSTCVLKVVPRIKGDDTVVTEIKVQKEAQRCPFILRLYGSFETDTHHFTVIEWSQCNLFALMTEHFGSKLFTSNLALYAAQILVAMEHLHKLGYVHRYFKLEHVLLRESGSLVLGEYSLAQRMDAFKKSTQMCGTAEYRSPEMISGQGYGYMTDIWAYGVLVYEMFTFATPFKSEYSVSDPKNLKLYTNIATFKQISFPQRARVPEQAQQFITQLLKPIPERRLGAGDVMGDYKSIKGHAFFEGIDWAALVDGSLGPTLQPQLNNDEELRPVKRPLLWERVSQYRTNK